MNMTSEPRIAKVRIPSEEDQGTQKAADGQLTPRDLRRARRKAKRLGLTPADDYDAVRLLRKKGIDFNDGNSILEFVPPPETPDQSEGGLVQMPVETPGRDQASPQQGEPEVMNEAERAVAIAGIQRHLVRRRRRRLALLLLKLLFFVALPTWLVGHYYYTMATDMFETQSEFVIQKSESSANPMGGLFAGTGFATSQDSVTVQGYLTSREALRRLDEDHGFVAHFQQDSIDDIQRLQTDSTAEDAYKLYQKRVTVGFDPTEGIIRMAVVAASPEASEAFSGALISYAEERVDQLSQRVRGDQMAGATAAYEKAETEVVAAQTRVLELQQTRGILSAEVEISAQMTLINSLELEREQQRLDLAQIEANARPNDTRVAVLRDSLQRLEARIDELRSAMTQSGDDHASLARVSGELAVAEANLANRQMMLQSALQQVETARIEANRQVRYLSMGVSPTAPDVASYPRKFENTILAFVIFLSIYILISLTVSILREQVSV